MTDLFEIRRLAFINLLEERCGGSQAKLAECLDVNATYVSRMLSAPSNKSHKNISDTLLDKARKAFNLPLSWPDAETDGVQVSVRPDQMDALRAVLRSLGVEVASDAGNLTRLVIKTQPFDDTQKRN